MDISTAILRIDYATPDRLARIRKVARRHGGTVKVTRYARDAYEGTVTVPSPWTEGRDAHLARVAAIKAVI